MLRSSRLAICLLVITAVLPVVGLGDEPKPPMLTPEEQKLAAEATRLDGEGRQLYQQGKPADAVAKMRQALEIRQRLYPWSKYTDGHADLAESLSNLGFMLLAMGQAEQAAPFHQQSLDMNRKLYPAAKYPDGHPELVGSLNNLGFLLQAMGQAEEAVTVYQQSLDMMRKLYPATKYPAGHPVLAYGLNNLGGVFHALGQTEKAATFFQQSLDMRLKLYPASKYPDGHPDLAGSLNNLGGVLAAMGQTEKAATYFQQSLDMHRTLYPASKYPDGHPHLAVSLSGMGGVLAAMGQAEKAATFYEQSLDMFRKLYPAAIYPDGHPHLARSLNNLGFELQDLGRAERAASFFQQSLDMRRQLYPASKYPDGHPDLAVSFNNLGFALAAMGQVEKAAALHQQGLDMDRQLYPASKYPDGHLQLVLSLNNLGSATAAMGQAEQAASLHQKSLEMQQRLLRRELATASEEAAFDKINAQPLVRDSYLSVTRGLDTPAAESLRLLWSSRSMVTRLLEQRQANARAAGTELGSKLAQLRGLRRRTDQLLQNPRMKPEDRDQLLITVANERDQLERELVEKIPALKHWQELDKLGPDDLVQALPPGAVFVDVIRYTYFEYLDKKQKRTPSYVAFVVAKKTPSPPAPLPRSGGEGSVVRVELDDADSLDAAVRAWRSAIEERRGDAAAATIRERVWARLAPHVPPGTMTLYLAADGDLARLPWAALPIGQDRVLLEDYAIAQVPHGTFLLDQLKFGKKTEGGESLLALGGVDYGMGTWPALPGTAVETKAIAALAPGHRESLSGTDATPEKLQSLLPQARYVHLATHGQFQADALTAERQRAAKAAESRLLSDDSRKIAAKSPLGYVGLVLANGDVLSGLGIVDLPLQNTKLVTLSACETGLGEYTGGEGVQGLQRAFHLAGCPNVVASLWKVNDAATAALMTKFYHELWVNKKPPIEALREAQLTIYRRPDLIATLASAERGIKLEQALNAKGPPPAESKGRTPTKLWAAFVLSGVGK